MKIRTFALICGTLSLLACGTNSSIDSAPPEVAASSATYMLGVDDLVAINVWRNEELSLNLPVRPDGKISLPLVGDLQAAGVSTTELSTEIESKLSQFIRNPQVTVIVVEANSNDYLRRVRVTGAVENPISIPYRQGMTVLDLILEAGGVNEFAILNSAKLYRKSGEGVQAYNVRLGNILRKGQLDTNYVLSPSDIVTVPERTF